MSVDETAESRRIIYSLVARQDAVLAEYTLPGLTGNFSTVTRVILGKIPPEDGKLSYVYDKYLFHYVVSDGITYLCMADERMGRVIPFEFLGDVRERFVSSYGDRAKSAIAYAFNADFQRTLSNRMEAYNDKVQNTKLVQVQKELQSVKGVMVENIDKVLARGEKIELLVDKSANLDRQALLFRKEAGIVRRQMWWKNVKVWIVLILLLALILFIIITASCGGLQYPKCKSN